MSEIGDMAPFCFGFRGKAECIYKDTCALYLKNMRDGTDEDPDWYRMVEPDLKKWTCYVPLDGSMM